MNTKEAIEMVCIGREQPLEFDEAHEIVELLKRGENFEKMWREVIEANKVLKMCMDFDELEQKYFPKLKKTIAIEIEGENEDISKFTDRLNRVVGKINFGVRTNIKEEKR